MRHSLVSRKTQVGEVGHVMLPLTWGEAEPGRGGEAGFCFLGFYRNIMKGERVVNARLCYVIVL